MKRFEISSKCNGCGLCFSTTDLIKENSKGIAEAVQGAMITDSIYNTAQEIMKDCPEQAISIVDAESYNSIEEYISKMKIKLNQIPAAKVTKSDIKFDANKYTMEVGDYSFSEEYSSESQAERAGLREFDRVAYSQYRRMILSVFVQYQNDKLKPYYTCDSSGFYAQYNQKYLEVLKEIVEGVKAYSNGKIKLPSDFASQSILAIGPGESARSIEFNLYGIEHFHEHSTDSGVMAEFNSGSYSSLSSYSMYIDTDERESLETGLFGRDKWTTKYRYTSASLREACQNYIRDLNSAMNSVDIDESALFFVERSVEAYNKQVNKVIEQKIDILNNTLR